MLPRSTSKNQEDVSPYSRNLQERQNFTATLNQIQSMYVDDGIDKLTIPGKSQSTHALDENNKRNRGEKKPLRGRRKKKDHKHIQDLKEGKVGLKSMTEFEKMGEDIETPWMQEVYGLLSKYKDEEKQKKGARHFIDALFIRKTRHDIEVNGGKFLKTVYFIQTHNYWQNWLFFLGWVFTFLAVFEPSYKGEDDFFDHNDGYYTICIWTESIILFCFLLELFMDLFHRRNNPHLSFTDKYINNFKVFSKIILISLFSIDFIVFHASLPHVVYRFSRLFRPYTLVLFKKEMRRTFTGIIRSMREMVVILIFFLIIVVVYAFFGARIIGQLDGQDDIASNFGDFGYTLNNMYLLLSRDNYPGIMIPSYETSPLFVLYFIPFLLFDILLLVPIPIATMFEAFKNQTGLLVIKDRIKEREALFSAFLCIDLDCNMKLDEDEFQILFKIVYNGRAYPHKVNEIFRYLDEEDKGYLTLKNFFNILEALENTRDLVNPEFVKVALWNNLRGMINKLFKFDKIAKSGLFETLMTLVILVNAGILIAYTFTSDDDTTDLLDNLDGYFLYIYIVEIVVKLLGLGFIEYFSDGWNILDFVLTLITIVTQIAVSVTRFAKTARASKFVKSLRAQRALKLIRIVRSVKIFKFCFGPKSTFRNFKKLLNNIMICLPIVAKLTIILFMITYSYAIVGMEIWNHHYEIHEESPYIEHYVTFEDIGNAMLSLFHVINQAEWAKLEYDYIYRYNSLGKAALFFNSYHALASLIIISLLTGLIWEVFTFMSENLEEQSRVEKMVEDLTMIEEQIRKDLRRQRPLKSGSMKRATTLIDRAKTTPFLEFGTTKLLPTHSFGVSEAESRNELSKKSTRRYSMEKMNTNQDNGLPSNENGPNIPKEKSHLLHIPFNFEVDLPMESVAKPPQSHGELTPNNRYRISNQGMFNKSFDATNKPPELKHFRIQSLTRAISERGVPFKLMNHTDTSNIMIPLPLLTGDEGDVTYASNNDNNLMTVETEIPLMSSRKQKSIIKNRRYSVGRPLLNISPPETIPNVHEKVEYPFDEFPYELTENNHEYQKKEMIFYIRKFSISLQTSFQRNQMEYIMDKKDSQAHIKSEKLFLKLVDETEADIEEINTLRKINVLKIKETQATILKKIEIKKRKLLYSIPNSERIIRKALLRGANKANIREYEENHMKSVYGKWFENLQETDMSGFLNVFEAENHCIIRMSRLMKQPALGPVDFLEVLHLIETSINQNLMQVGSIAKFLFCDSQDNWFFTYQDEEVLKFHKLKFGFWNHFDDIFTEKNRLYEAHDVFTNHFSDKKFDEVTTNFFISMKRISRIVDRNTFKDYEQSEHTWNSFVIPFQTDDPGKIRASLIHHVKDDPRIKFKHIAPNVVRKGIFVSVNYGTKIKKRHLEEDGGLSDLKQPGPPSERGSRILEGHRRASLHRSKNIRKVSKRFDDDILKGKKEEDELENMGKGTKENEFLPATELVEFMKDVRDIVGYHKEYFLTKMSTFYLLKNTQ